MHKLVRQKYRLTEKGESSPDALIARLFKTPVLSLGAHPGNLSARYGCEATIFDRP